MHKEKEKKRKEKQFFRDKIERNKNTLMTIYCNDNRYNNNMYYS